MSDQPVYYGIKRVTASSEDVLVHEWVLTSDANDMLLPGGMFIPLASFTQNDVVAALEQAYPRSPGGSSRVSFNTYANRGRAFTVPIYALPSYRRGVTAAARQAVERAGGPAYLTTSYASAALKAAYEEEDYQTAPLVLKAIGDNMILARPDPKAARVRLGKRQAAQARAQKKREAQEKARQDDDARYRKRQRVSELFNQLTAAADDLLTGCPRLRACGRWNRLYVPQVPVSPDDVKAGSYRDYRERHAVCGFRAAVWLHRRLTHGDHWTTRSSVRTAADLFVKAEADGLLGDPEFHKVHADDAADVAWFSRQAVKICRTVAALAAAPPPPAKE